MDVLLTGYEVNASTWFWLSLLLILAAYFRFDRFWSLRNLDLLLLASLSPGLIFVRSGFFQQGYVWLFVVSGILLVRMFLDSLFHRRPRLEQNLNRQGLAFLLIATAGFQVTKVMTEPPPASTVKTVRSADNLIKRQDATENRKESEAGPASSVFAALLVTLSGGIDVVAARVMAILAHIAVVIGLIMVGKQLFGDSQMGLAMATLYLILPCTSLDVQKVNHVLPAALIVWSFVAYRIPLLAGCLMGLACGTLFFPVFLLPLWMAFYDRRGAMNFGISLVLVSALLLGSLVLTSADTYSFTRQIIGSIDWSILRFQGESAEGFWSNRPQAYRIPVFAAYVVMLICLTIWPRRKNVEHLMAHSAALVVGTQFWYPQQGGVYLLWYLPLFLMVVFRPRIAHLTPPELNRKATEPKQEPAPELMRV